MKVTPWCLAALAPIAVAGCSGAFLGHFAVLALTFGIFFGTLSLGRHTALSVATDTTPHGTPQAMGSGEAPTVGGLGG